MLCFRLRQVVGKVESVPMRFESPEELQSLLHSRGLSFGLGVFETLLVVNGRVVLLDEHLARMEKGAVALNLLFSIKTMREQLTKHFDCYSSTPSGILKLSLFADAPSAEARGYAQSALPSSSLLRPEFVSMDSAAVSVTGGVVVSALRITDICYPWPKALVGLKLMSAVQYVHWSSQALAQGFQQGVLFDDQNHLLEGTSANIIVHQRDGTLKTPYMAMSGVHGTLRHYLLKNKVIECADLTEQALYDADSVWFCNSVRGLQRLSYYEGSVGSKTWNAQDLQKSQGDAAVLKMFEAVKRLFLYTI